MTRRRAISVAVFPPVVHVAVERQYHDKNAFSLKCPGRRRVRHDMFWTDTFWQKIVTQDAVFKAHFAVYPKTNAFVGMLRSGECSYWP